MSSFDITSRIGWEGISQLAPWFKHEAGDRYVVLDGNPLATRMQRDEKRGDVLLQTPRGPEFAEIKTEIVWTGNVPWETWSNRKAQIPGWAETLSLDVTWLVYFYMSNQRLVALRWTDFRAWATSAPLGQRTVDRFREVEQSKYIQTNDTWFRLIPVAVLKRELCVESCREYYILNGKISPVKSNLSLWA